MQLWCSDMSMRVTPDEVRAWFAAHMNRRPDFGLRKAILDVMLHPRSPFNAAERRRFRGSFVCAVAWVGAVIGVFVLFNLTR